MHTIQGKQLTVMADMTAATFAVTMACGDTWTLPGSPYVALTDGRVIYLRECAVTATAYATGTRHGVKAHYELGAGMTLYTLVYLENARDDLYFESRLEGDAPGQVQAVVFPSAVDFDAAVGHGYTVLPRMQGTLVPAGSPIQIANGVIYERDAYMPMFGQVRDGSGYLAVVDTPYDARYALLGESIEFRFVPSLGRMTYPRRMLYRFLAACDYNDLAHSYRDYLAERGRLHTLREKAARNPAVERLFGCPIVHESIAVHISPDSDYYEPGNAAHNDYHVPFDTRAEQLRALKARGLDKAYLHFDGWGNHGYDNLHPDPLPPHEAAGGAEGMRRLGTTARELGYIFGIHDQYRDYYYDAPTFDLDNAIMALDGSHPYCSVWYGGAHSFLCATLAIEYVRRNYDELERLEIPVEAAYLDVFSVVELDECHNPAHPMTREQCAIARNECLHYLTSRGIIPSSEETLGCMMESQVLCHHAPFYTTSFEGGDAVGIPLPLYNLVYHDCVVIPWDAALLERGGWGIPNGDAAETHAILNAGPVYCSIAATEAEIARVRSICALAERLTHARMLRHEFTDATYRRQRTLWSDGTVIEVDFDTKDYRITHS